ncbi:SDR family NAD(P)-dependent oxidoreductase [Gallaecimonas xiamenensis]|uniref:NAD-dependent epimerase n=1 Tax=Gallaecimonas xiamenensis 3-C-1 TaxID=745411 RepID=K2JQF1_9GAMM|nr:SDR family oxidoreductase [Gallaecimonas xiamenensis]EKE76747.1 NAD-dependent epimerase [Gallaecimonas xiamenensis 3-C-1]
MSAKPYVIVTGGARNIGQAISLRMQQDGYQVIVLDVAAPEAPSLTHHYQIDLSDGQATAELVKALGQEFGITRLVNNVGLVKPAGLDEVSEADFLSLMHLNTLCALHCVQALTPVMRQQGFGRIVNNCSRVVLGKTDRSAYSASKGALLSMARTWALELGPHGITVNNVAPGPIATSAFWANNPPGSPKAQKIIDNIPLGRMGQPEDVAQAMSFFLDERSGFITGQTLYVCGGVTTGLAPV